MGVRYSIQGQATPTAVLTIYEADSLVLATIYDAQAGGAIKMTPSIGINRAGEGTVLAEVLIPSFCDSGEYRIRITYSYELFSFPSRRIDVVAMTPPFTVINKDRELQKALVDTVIESKVKSRLNAEKIGELKKSIEKTDKKADRIDRLLK
jgi:hypothetical protein